MKKNKYNLILLALLTFVILFFVLKDDFNNILSALFNIKYYYILLILFIIFVSDLIKALVLYNSCKANEIKYEYLECLKLVVVSHFFDGITPFASGGQAYQILKLKSKDINYSKGIGLIFYNFTIFHFSFLILSILSVVLNNIFNFFVLPTMLNRVLILGLIINLIIGLISGLIFFKKKNNLKFIYKVLGFLVKIKVIRKEKYEKFVKYVDSLVRSLSNVEKNWFSICKILLLNFLFLICFYSVPYFVFLALGVHDINIFLSLLLYFHVALISTYVPMPGAMVGFEYAFLYLFGLYITGPILKAGMLLWRFLTYYLLMIVGLILFLINKKEV